MDDRETAVKSGKMAQIRASKRTCTITSIRHPSTICLLTVLAVLALAFYQIGNLGTYSLYTGDLLDALQAISGSNDRATYKIPKRIYQSWITKDGMPEKMAKNVQSWKDLNPDYEHVFFNDTEQRNWMESHCQEYWPAWRDMVLPAGRADLFRYCILYTLGGVWSDIDVEPKQGLSDFMNDNATLVVVHDGGMKEYGDVYLYNAFLASIKGHASLKRAMDIIWEHYTKRLLASAVTCTGPGVLWRAVNNTFGTVRGSDFVGLDEEKKIDFLHFDGHLIKSKGNDVVLIGKYAGYLDDASTHGGEPHYGRQVEWNVTDS